jgi:lactate permease
MIEKVPPVAAQADARRARCSRSLTVSYTGSGMLLSAIISGFIMGSPCEDDCGIWPHHQDLVRLLADHHHADAGLGTLTRYSGLDTTLGLAFANTGVLYPFFGTLMGWLGVALTGSDTASNVLFGGMQKVAADQLGLSPNLMGAANSSGGVMGKMIDAQSIVVASTATRWFNHEGEILRFVFFHSIVLACLVGLYVTLQAYVWPFTLMVVK